MHDDLYIDTPQRLAALCRRLEGRPWLALDTEFLRDKSYRPRLCLLQVAVEDAIACVDPLALDDLTPLLDLLYDPSIVKVLHSAYQDLEIFYYLRGAPPRPVFDTQIAALLAGHGDQIGYASLVQALLGVKLDKAHTRTDWSRRPLHPEQLQYAADDVRYLGPLYLRLRDELEHRGRLAWLQEDFTALTDPATYANPPETAWRRIRGAERLTDAQFAVLAALAAWREQTAQRNDRPRQWILSDDCLLELARHRPASLEKLAGIRDLKPGALDKYGADLLELIRAARHAPAAARPERR
ncbi:MAG: ribonuclease D, partial [Gammaproteobacteria bacterium]|nr:ribonuclease D [Gammaproteobacteria bacterium]